MITILGANNLFPHIYHKYQVYAANDYFHHKTSAPLSPPYMNISNLPMQKCVSGLKNKFLW